MTKLLQSAWCVAGIGALLFLATTFLSLRPQNFLSAVARTGAATVNQVEKNAFLFGEVNPEFDQMVAELKKERASVADQAQRLKDLELRLQSERGEITTVTQTIYQLQKEFDRSVVRVREEEIANLKKLAKTYAAMTPDNAALIFKEMPDEQIVRISVFMKDSEIAPVLEALSKLDKDETKRVVSISERLRLAIFRSPTDKPKTP